MALCSYPDWMNYHSNKLCEQNKKEGVSPLFIIQMSAYT